VERRAGQRACLARLPGAGPIAQTTGIRLTMVGTTAMPFLHLTKEAGGIAHFVDGDIALALAPFAPRPPPTPTSATEPWTGSGSFCRPARAMLGTRHPGLRQRSFPPAACESIPAMAGVAGSRLAASGKWGCQQLGPHHDRARGRGYALLDRAARVGRAAGTAAGDALSETHGPFRAGSRHVHEG
jgi:hypothetical protein